MDRRTVGLIVAIAGIIGYLFTSERAEKFSLYEHLARHFSEGSGMKLNAVEMAAKYRFWMGLSIGCALVAIIGIIIIITGYNRIRRHRQANGRQSDIDHR